MGKALLSARRLSMAVSATGLFLALAPSSARAQNMLTDPGFEVSQGNVDASGGDQPGATGWLSFGNGAYTSSYLSGQGPIAHSGDQTFKTYNSFNGAYQQFAVTPGQTYTATVWVEDSDQANFGNDKEGNGTVDQLELNMYPDNGSGQPNTGAGYFSVDPVITVSSSSPLDTWVEGTITVTVPNTDAFMRFQINCSTYTGGAEIGRASCRERV